VPHALSASGLDYGTRKFNLIVAVDITEQQSPGTDYRSSQGDDSKTRQIRKFSNVD
jgi:hypothetical protein